MSGVIQRIALSGPVPYGGAADDATPIVDLCGGSATACDLGTTGRVCGDSDTSLIADSIATIIGNICENPHLYHLNVFTSTFPSGAMRGPLS